MKIPCFSIFRYNLLKGLIFGNLLVYIFGAYPQFGFRFALLYWLVMSPYILYLYKKERDALRKDYGWKRGGEIALRLLFLRYFIGFLAFLGATVGYYLGKNIFSFIVAGTVWSVIYSKIRADTECLRKSQ
ncbi:hypothetical protein [Thermococcus sp.]|uniref:hypothetical protein n=1 Tax=Thermococcus sp. TaxID=35749 RepID=UPI00261B0672|nr:hypothetical protein [Thermococcus sp.]